MRLVHGRTQIELHELREGAGVPLLLLHELGASALAWDDAVVASWPGSVYALDFSGHGDSEFNPGGAYPPEHFLAEADIALHAIRPTGECAVAGAGIGAYVGLMLAAARRDQIAAALLLPGRGLEGGGAVPDRENRTISSLEQWEAATERMAARYLPGTDRDVSECENDIRPDDYVKEFARAARRLLLSEAVSRQAEVPSWWHLLSGDVVAAGEHAPSDFTSAVLALRDTCNEENAA